MPEKAYIDLDIRPLPRQDNEYIISQLRQALGSLAEEAEIEDLPGDEGTFMSIGNSSPSRSDFVDAMEKAVRKEIPNATLVPLIFPATTDCRFLREVGAEVYGFSLFDPEVGVHDLSHGVNERVGIKTLDLSQKVYYHLARDFLK